MTPITLRFASGKPTQFDFEPRAHWDLGPELGMIDFDRGVKRRELASIFLVAWARMERALVSFAVDTHNQAGFKSGGLVITNQGFSVWHWSAS